MDWIHCNTCSLQPGDQKDRNFALTSCGHIYCDLCVVASTKEKCRICGSQCNTVQLTAQMRPDVQHFFTEPEDVLKKALKIMEFQKGHRQRLTSYRRSMVTREIAAVEEIKKLRSRVQELEGHVSQLKSMLAAYDHKRRPPGQGEMTPHLQHKSPASVKSPPWLVGQAQSRVPASSYTPTSTQQSPQQQHHKSATQPQAGQSEYSSPQQQKGLSPAKSDSWVTPNRLTLRKSPSQPSQSSALSPISPANYSRPSTWNISPGMQRSNSQVASLSSSSKRPPSRISPYMPMKANLGLSASQGTMTLSPSERFRYLSSNPARK